MKPLARIFWTPWHLIWSGLALAWFARTRGGVCVFTHFHDVDQQGLDRQMGPLVDALLERGEALVEWTLVPFGALLKNVRIKQRMFVSHAALLGLAWLLTLGTSDKRRRMRARVRVARWFLLALRPRALYLIDESGSGQCLLQAGRELGLPVVAVQHGDFALSQQYRPAPGGEFAVEPADVFCVWSPWFRRRLLEVSPIYGEANTLVTGRMRYEPPPPPPRADRIAVLVLAERGDWLVRIEPFLAAIADCEDLTVVVRSHPAESGGQPLPSLTEALLASDVALGRASSALLEALYWERPVIVCPDDPAGLAAAGIGRLCPHPSGLVELCRAAAGASGKTAARAARARVWGGSPRNPVAAILAARAMRRNGVDLGLLAPATSVDENDEERPDQL